MIDFSNNSTKTIHPYINDRIEHIQNALYPKNHLWGIDIFDENKNYPSRIIPNTKFPSPINRAFRRFLLSNFSPGLNIEILSFLQSFRSLILYSVCGPLSLVPIYGNAKIFCWVFSPPRKNYKGFFHPYNQNNLRNYSGFLCLTPKAEKYFSQFAPSKFIPWCVDLEMFDGKNSHESADKPFFLASGKTGRDYETLIKAAPETKAEIRIIGPINQRPTSCPDNVNWIETSINPPDQAIDYPTLKKWYAQCSGVCIPLSGDANDTCGYTNMLEGMAMAKPVLMTRSGCLHIDPKSQNFGLLIEPQDSKGWSNSMNKIINDPATANKFGEKGRKIAEYEFNIDRFNNDVISFINKILEN